MLSEHCVLFVGHRNIMAQSTDPPDIEQSQKYRVKKKQKGILGENSNVYAFCIPRILLRM